MANLIAYDIGTYLMYFPTTFEVNSLASNFPTMATSAKSPF